VLPPEALAGGDPKARPHLLLTQCGESDVCTLAYCSTSAAEAAFGASHHVVNPFRTRYRGSGFNEATFVYLSRLIAIRAEDLGKSVGRVIDDMVPVRDRLREALGLRTGTGAESGEAAGSQRGQVVTLEAELARELDTPYAVVVTEPRYSLQERFQLVIPVYDAAEFEPLDDDVVIENEEWIRRLGITASSILLAVSYLQSVFQPDHVVGLTGVLLDARTMNETDELLRIRFGL
jgi:hypothetical protein